AECFFDVAAKPLIAFTILLAPDLSTQRPEPLKYLLPQNVEFAGETHDIDERRAQIVANDVYEPLNLLICLAQKSSLVAQALIELFLLGFNQLARGVVGANKQIADDDALRVAQRRDG